MAFVDVGIAAASMVGVEGLGTVAAGAIGSGLVGAGVGGLMAGIQGKNVLNGALMGGALGAVGGGIGGSFMGGAAGDVSGTIGTDIASMNAANASSSQIAESLMAVSGGRAVGGGGRVGNNAAGAWIACRAAVLWGNLVPGLGFFQCVSVSLFVCGGSFSVFGERGGYYVGVSGGGAAAGPLADLGARCRSSVLRGAAGNPCGVDVAAEQNVRGHGDPLADDYC